MVTVSTVVARSNPEVVEARRRGTAVLPRADVLAAIASLRKCIAIAGTHGKTTTASMLALVLVEAGIHPSFLIGGDVNEIGTNAVWDAGEWIVVEADESDGTFLSLSPDIAVVTSVEADHLDHYGSFASLREAFDRFLSSARRNRVVGGDDPQAAEIGRAYGADTVGTDPASTHRMTDVSLAAELGLLSALARWGGARSRLHPGAGAPQCVQRRGSGGDGARRGRTVRRGSPRARPVRGGRPTVRIPGERAGSPSSTTTRTCRARCAPRSMAALDGGWQRVVAVFQPHRYTRTAELWEEFGPAFRGADVVVVTDVYGAGEGPKPGITGQLVADSVRRALPGVPVHYAAAREELRRRVGALLEPGDLCCTLGAGDLTSLPDELMEAPGW